jgi:4-amino-4-deoxychorismate lyase
MCLLFETIKIFNKTAFNLEYHNERMNKARRELLGCNDFIDLNQCIIIPENITRQLYKCRVIYSQGTEKIEFEPYFKRQIKILRLVECDSIDYSYKFVNRKKFDELLLNGGDEILIIKNGNITDTSFSNIVFFDGSKWITPANPLLKGTRRERLLQEKMIVEDVITKNNLKNFSKASLINAMLDLEEQTLTTKNIF